MSFSLTLVLLSIEFLKLDVLYRTFYNLLLVAHHLAILVPQVLKYSTLLVSPKGQSKKKNLPGKNFDTNVSIIILA